jgi:hypothetical protein
MEWVLYAVGVVFFGWVIWLANKEEKVPADRPRFGGGGDYTPPEVPEAAEVAIDRFVAATIVEEPTTAVKKAPAKKKTVTKKTAAKKVVKKKAAKKPRR